MADPISIATGVFALIKVSAKATDLVKQFYDEVGVVDTTLTGLLNDVDGFQQVLQSMNETLEHDEIKSNLLATGHMGSHWKNLARSLDDGRNTVQELYNLLEGINKTTSVLDKSRRQIRLRSASEQIATYREQIHSYRAAIQLSLSTIILSPGWNQVTFQKSTNQLPEKIIPTLDKLYDEFRSFGALLNFKIKTIQDTVTNQSSEGHHELRKLNNLRECLHSAADVVSTASTALTVETSEKVSIRNGSDFGDIFPKDANEPMLRWMSSRTVYEFEDAESPLPNPSEASKRENMTEYQSDSDSDLENEMIRVLFDDGKKRKESGDFLGASRLFRNCLTRLSSNTSYTSLKSLKSGSRSGISKVELLELLVDTYSSLGSWDQAESIMREKLSITERQVGKKNEVYLWDTIKLAELMVKNKKYVEAHLQGRRSLGGFKKLGEPGQTGYEKCLAFLIQLCNEEGKLDEEEAYTALLDSHRRKFKQMSASPIPVESANPHDKNPSEDIIRQKNSIGIMKREPPETLNNADIRTRDKIRNREIKETKGTTDAPFISSQCGARVTDQIDDGSAQSSEIITPGEPSTDPKHAEDLLSIQNIPTSVSFQTPILSDPDLSSQGGGSDVAAPTISTGSKPKDFSPCPICFQNLSNLPNEQAWIHMNNCLDSNQPLRKDVPTSEEMKKNLHTDSSYGTWACSSCKSLSLQPLLETRYMSCGKKRSKYCPSSLNNFERQPFDRYRTFIVSLDLEALEPSDGTIPQRKVLLLGDTFCGKTYLASAWSEGSPHQNMSLCNNFSKVMTVQSHQIELQLCDVTGRTDNGATKMRRFEYTNVDVLLICFNISCDYALENIEEEWEIEAENFLRDIPKILVGCQKDRRNSRSACDKNTGMAISPYAGDQFAKKMRALAYFETSAKNGHDLAKLFDYVAEVVLRTASKSESLLPKRLFSRRGLKLMTSS